MMWSFIKNEISKAFLQDGAICDWFKSIIVGITEIRHNIRIVKDFHTHSPGYPGYQMLNLIW